MENFDPRALTDGELVTIITECLAEQSRRADLLRAFNADETLAGMYQTATLDREPGEPWRQPLGDFQGYALGWQVTHNGKTWESLLSNNVWEPGISGWREIAEGGRTPEWVQPTGAHDAYQKGDQVSHKDHLWESTADGNVWEPGMYGWDDLGSLEEPDPEPEEPTEEIN